MKNSIQALMAVLALFAAGGAIWWLNSARKAPAPPEPFRIGYAIESPFAFQADSRLQGESIDIAKLLAAKLGLQRVEWVNCDFDKLIPNLREGDFDMIACGLFITPERKQQVAFTLPTFKARQGLLVAKGNPLKLKSYRQAVESKARLAALNGSYEEALLEKLGATSSQLIVVPDALTGRIAVETGRADALALSAPSVRWMSMTSGKAELLEALDSLEQSEKPSLGAFAFRLEDSKRLHLWNTELLRFIGSDEHLELVKQHGFTKADIPSKDELQEARK